MKLKISKGNVKGCIICDDVFDARRSFEEEQKKLLESGEIDTVAEYEGVPGYTIYKGDTIDSFFSVGICRKCMNALRYASMKLDNDSAMLAVITDTDLHE